MSSSKFHQEKHEKALEKLTTAQFQGKVIRKNVLCGECHILLKQMIQKNANMNFDNFSIHC